MRHGLLLAALALASSWAAAARAAGASDDGVRDGHDGKERRLAFLRFRGPGAELARAAVMDGLEDEATVRLVPIRVVEAQKDLTGSTRDRAAEIGNRLRLLGLVRGRVARVSDGFQATLTLVSGRDGLPVGKVAFRGTSLLDLYTRLRSQGWSKLRPLLEDAETAAGGAAVAGRDASEEEEEEAPAAAASASASGGAGAGAGSRAGAGSSGSGSRTAGGTSGSGSRAGAGSGASSAGAARTPEVAAADSPSGAPPARATDETEEEEEAPGAGGAGPEATAEAVGPAPSAGRGPVCSIADVETGGGAMFRAFNYRGEERGALRAYTLTRAPIGRVEGGLFPFAGAAPCGVAGALGIRAAYEQMMPVTSRIADRPLETGAFAYQGEVVVRIPVGAFTLRPSVGYFVRRYSLKGGVVPNVTYRSAGGDLAAELRLGALTIEIGGGARLVLSAGQIESTAWFPEATATTYTGRVRIAWTLVRWLEIVAGGDADYSSFRFNIPGGATAVGYPNGVAAGAYDLYLRGLLALRAHIPPGSP